MNFLNTPEKRDRRLVHLPMGRFGEAIEIAKGALFRESILPKILPPSCPAPARSPLLPRRALLGALMNRTLTAFPGLLLYSGERRQQLHDGESRRSAP